MTDWIKRHGLIFLLLLLALGAILSADERTGTGMSPGEAEWDAEQLDR